MKLWVAYTALGLACAFILALALVGCSDQPACQNTITGTNNTVICSDGAGQNSPQTGTNPAPVVVPPVVVTEETR